MTRDIAARGAEHHSEGSVSILTVIFLVPLMLCMAVVADSGRAWVAREALQNSIERAAQATAEQWATDAVACGRESLATASIDDSSPDQVDCTTTGNGGSGTVTVSGSDEVDLFFPELVGRKTAVVEASTTVKLSASGAVSGLWPFGLCSNSLPVKSWVASNFTYNIDQTITFADNAAACGANVKGNWAVLDFNGGSNSTSETMKWIDAGYQDLVTVGDLVPGNTGIPSSSLNLDSRIGLSVLLALFDTAQGSGSNALFHIVGFARARLVSYTLTGSASLRDMTVRFERGVLSGNSTSLTAQPFGLVTRSICALDSQGDCS